MCTNVAIAEALACQVGIQIALDQNFRNIFIESDCLELVRVLKKSVHPPSYLGNVATSIQANFSNFDRIEFRWVKRSANMLAHRLSRYAFDASCPRLFVGSILP